ncbi:hypothetical protein [Candidatus Liberibacter solanacearum]|uniref:hypothetical protein n=1 Tax=Candidatus Liberibacter solanacearum TaxID=556287 RepID=UPI00130116B5|nr:hypothetical protein [Candidatus Liberibacter solanacearum]
MVMRPLVCFVEIASFLSRPISLSLPVYFQNSAGHNYVKKYSAWEIVIFLSYPW